MTDKERLADIQERHDARQVGLYGNQAHKDRGELLRMVDEAQTWTELYDKQLQEALQRAESLQQVIDDVEELQRYTSQPFGHTSKGVTFVKTDDGGLVLHKDIKAALNRSKT